MNEPDITLGQKVAELRRELGYRRTVYARLVREGKMTQAEADYRQGVMEAITRDYERQLEPDLFA